MENQIYDPTISYDIVELPSRGIYYSNKKKSVRVSFLTASDENILSSQNLINSGNVINELLKRKIMDKDFLIDDIDEDDKKAILLFLRNTAFGGDYQINTIDPKTNEQFTAKIDLTNVKIKDFDLKQNEDGDYSFHMDKSNVDITFNFLTAKQQRELDKIKKSWNSETTQPPIVTKSLEMMIKSVNGNKDMMFIHNFVEMLPIIDSKQFKKYVNENKPGLDLTKTVKTPSGDDIQIEIGFGVEFFRPFYEI